jgi:hypothetical protein
MAERPPMNPENAGLTHRGACRVVPRHDGDPSGDAATLLHAGATAHAPATTLMVIVDGLGHGPLAAHAAEVAMQAIADQPDAALSTLFVRLDARLQSTRGAAVGIARLEGRVLTHVAVGNTRFAHWRGPRLTRLASQAGIVGGTLPQRLAVNKLELLPGDWLLMFTDGIAEHVQLPVQLPEWERDPATLCDFVLARWRDDLDDAGVLALRVGDL